MPGSDSVYPNLSEEQWSMIPDYMRPGVETYVDDGIVPGDFLKAVLSNDLKEAAFHADHTNYLKLGDYAKFIYWHLPYACQGSREKVIAWANAGGLKGGALDARPDGSEEGA